MAVDYKFMVLIIQAMQEGNYQKVIDRIKQHSLQHKHYEGESPLYVACSEGSVLIVKYLLEHTDAVKDLNTIVHTTSPLMIACLNRHTTVVRYLLQQPTIEPSQKNSAGNTALCLAWGTQHMSAVKQLLAHEKINKDDINCLLQMTGIKGDLATIKLIASKEHFDMNAILVEKDTLLMLACKNDHFHIIQYLLQQPSMDLKKHNQGAAAVLIAAGRHNHDIAQFLLNKMKGLTN